MQFNVAQREIVLKVVFYGPPLSGKTTNLQSIHRLLPTPLTGRMTTLDTSDDRTLFFDLLPVSVRSESGFAIKLKLMTVPGQIIHAATRRIVLSGADGVVFVADSRLEESKLNNEYWHGMRHYLTESGLDASAIPTVIQFNKRDLENIRSDAELEKIAAHSPEPVFAAVAIRDEGVLETLYGILVELFKDLNRRYDFERKFQVSAKDFLLALFPNLQELAMSQPVGREASS